MKKHLFPGLNMIILGVVVLITGLTVNAQTYNYDFQDGKVYLKFKDHVTVDIPVNADHTVNLEDAGFIQKMMDKYSITAMSQPFWINDDPKLLRTFMIEFSDFSEIEEMRTNLEKNANLEYVEFVPMDRINWVPNDELYNKTTASKNWNWQFDVVNAEMAWDLATGSEDIIVAVVDNAVWTEHEDLDVAISYYTQGGPGSNSDPPGTGNAGEWSHGTHCAGLVAGLTNNGVGIASLGHGVSLMGIRASSTNPQNISAGYSGLQWAANNGANVVSMSWGNTFFSQSNQNLINTIHNMGVAMLASAGNDNVGTNHYPSGYNHVMGIASTNEDDVKSDFSNFGPQVDLSSPGGYATGGPNGLMSSTFEETSFGYYDTYFGTSMACPFAASLAGLLLSINPDLSPDQLENLMKSTAANIDTIPGNAQWSGQLGAGRIDAYNAVMNCPFEPTAMFSTLVPYITPGTTIVFTDESTGIPDEWSWEFDGGSPSQASDQNPAVTYNDEGIFQVSLAVENDFGLDVMTKEEYIEVTSTPHPWTLFEASETTVCAFDPVTITDMSLYDPTAWNWEISPATYSFVNGTTASSQNIEVEFEVAGWYTITLTASNANGDHSLTKDEYIYVQGIEMDYDQTFESGEAPEYTFEGSLHGQYSIDQRAAYNSFFGLHFQGGGGGSWSGTASNTTPEQAWEENTDFHASADNCAVDAQGIDGVTLRFMLRQTHSLGPKYSWLRVLINGEQVMDVDGVENFNPSGNLDPFVEKTFDLSEYGDGVFSIKFQSCCYFEDEFFAEGDNVFIDDIVITNTTRVDDPDASRAGVLTYPNPANGQINLSAHGLGSEFQARIINTQGQIVLEKSIEHYMSGQTRQLNVGSLPNGVYVLQLAGAENMITKKIVIE